MSGTEKATIECFGRCGCSVTVRKSKIRSAQYYLCHSKDHGRLCEEKLPPLPLGMVRTLEINAAAYLWGHTDQWMDAETAASRLRARQNLTIGMSQKAIEKARKHR